MEKKDDILAIITGVYAGPEVKGPAVRDNHPQPQRPAYPQNQEDGGEHRAAPVYAAPDPGRTASADYPEKAGGDAAFKCVYAGPVPHRKRRIAVRLKKLFRK